MFSDFHKCAVLNKHVHTKNKYNLFKAKNKVKIQIKQILYVLKIVHTLIYKYITGVNFNIIVILILRISYVYTMCSYHIHPPGLLNFVSSFLSPLVPLCSTHMLLSVGPSNGAWLAYQESYP